MQHKLVCRARKTILFLLAAALLLGIPFTGAAENADTPFYSESFEDNFTVAPSGWTAPTLFTSRTESYSSNGKASLLLTDATTSKSVAVGSPPLALEQGFYYRISVDVYNISGNGSVFIQFYDETGKQTGSVSSTATVTGRWTTLEFSVSMPEDASRAVILLYSGVANKGETCFDNIVVTRENGDTAQTIYDFSLKNKSFPRLFFDGSGLEALRVLSQENGACLAGYSGSEARAALLAEADTLLTQNSFRLTYYGSTTVTYSIPFAEKHFSAAPAGYGGSDYPYWQEMGNRMKEMMQTLSLAYALTGNAAYGQRAISLMRSLTAWTTWTEYPVINRTSLETGYFVTGVATVYDLCHGLMTDEEKRQTEEAIETLGLMPLFADLSSFTDHNYYVNKASSLAMGSLILLGNDSDAPRYLSRAYDFFRWYLEERSAAEGQEGLSYTSYSMELLFGALDCLKNVTGNDTLLKHPYAGVLFRWAVMSGENGQGSGPPISDRYSSTYFFAAAKSLEGTDTEGLANWYLSTRKFDVSPFLRLICYPTGTAAIETPTAYADRTGINLTNGVIGGAGWGALRTGWEKNDLLLLCVGNNSTQGHSHYDQNSFVLAMAGEWVLSDPGYQDYGGGYGTDYSLAYGHSTLYMDGRAQDRKGGGTLTAQLDSAAFSILTGSAAGAYDALDRFDRDFVMINYGDTSYYVLADDAEASASHLYSWVLNAEGIKSIKKNTEAGMYDPVVTGTSFHSSEFFVTGSSGSLRIAFDRELNISYGKWNGEGALITVSSGKKENNVNFCTVISALSGKGVNSITLEKSVKVEKSCADGKQNGVVTSHGDLRDILLFADKSGVSAEGLTGNGASASLLGLRTDGTYTGYAAVDTTRLSYAGRMLLSSDAPVSVGVFFDGSESVLLGTEGTAVTLYAPEGVNGIQPDAEGNCTLKLSGKRTVLRVNTTERAGADATDGTQSDTSQNDKPDASGKGCRSAVAGLSAIPVALFATVLLRRRKRRG